ncbi:FMN-binding protein [Natronincola ferrireducens]|uniref:Uncharacterized protein, contains FMN-binding domain n=1 Tax=Natronincola ferrireducens TaxID=393762 RepID=A0A1G8YPC3_9FIRM|nr:FMN-binding protein [Natronincola ferrireducens]SDK04596.1 Uncharacterized protein, contains FMN-binding domain [Natronincola ferrireducens]
MKKVLVLLLAMMMIISLIGCSTQTSADPEPGDETGEVVENKYVDGTYVGFDNAGEKSYSKAIVTIENDRIVGLELIGLTDMGEVKGEAYPYETFHQAKAALTEAFIAANGTEGVDVFTGATSSYNGWKLALERALEKALVEPASDNVYFDGTFHGATELGERGRKLAWVTIENDTIVDVVVKETRFVDDKEVFKDEEYTFEIFHEAAEEMPLRFIEANGTDVEIYTGATSSSTGWIEAVERALENAQR